MNAMPACRITFAAILLASAVSVQAQTPEQLAAAALEAAPVWDGHNDVPIQLRARFGNQIDDFDFHDTTHLVPEHGRGVMHTDLARLEAGRVGAQFWSVYVSPAMTEPEAVQATLEQIDVTKRLIARYPERLALALSADDVEQALERGLLASLLGMEGGHSIGSSLAVLRQMYDLGARYMTLTHNRNTPWADAATDAPVHGGLTDFGRLLVQEMMRMGMMVDLSHVSENVMVDTLDVAASLPGGGAPVIFSHSGARAINGHARNVPDSVLARMPDNGGIVMVVGLPLFLSEAMRQYGADRAAHRTRLETLWLGQPEAVAGGLAEWDAANPAVQATIGDMADHIDHVRSVAGIDHIGIGGDYDGMPTGPVGMEDVSGYPALFTELARRGYSQEELEKISNRNMMRVMRAAEQYASSVAALPPIETALGS